MSLEVEEIVDGAVGGNESLGLALRFEALHLAFSSSHLEVRILSSVVVPQSTRAMT